MVKHGADTSEVGIGLEGEIIAGKFVDIERPYIPDTGGGDDGGTA